MLVCAKFKKPDLATDHFYYLNWNDREAVRKFAAEANDWLRNGKDYSVITETIEP